MKLYELKIGEKIMVNDFYAQPSGHVFTRYFIIPTEVLLKTKQKIEIKLKRLG